jgi:hypothetical protein
MILNEIDLRDRSTKPVNDYTIAVPRLLKSSVSFFDDLQQISLALLSRAMNREVPDKLIKVGWLGDIFVKFS